MRCVRVLLIAVALVGGACGAPEDQPEGGRSVWPETAAPVLPQTSADTEDGERPGSSVGRAEDGASPTGVPMPVGSGPEGSVPESIGQPGPGEGSEAMPSTDMGREEPDTQDAPLAGAGGGPMASDPEAHGEGTAGEQADAGDPAEQTDQTDAGDTGDAGEGDVSGVGSVEGQVRFVGVGGWGLRAWTDDGVTWTDTINKITRDDHTPDLLRDVAFGGGRFVAVGGDANSMIMVSDDGRTWDEDKHPRGGVWLGGVAYLDGVWVAGGGNGYIVRSTDDGQTWSAVDTLDFHVRDMAAGQGAFIAIGDGGFVARSTDGGQTFSVDKVAGVSLSSVEFGFGVFVAVGSEWAGNGFDAGCIGSPDAGATWQACSLTSGRFDDVTVGPDGLVVAMEGGHAVTMDGHSFTTAAAGLPAQIAYGDGLWVGSTDDHRWSGTAAASLNKTSGGGFRALTAGRVSMP